MKNKLPLFIALLLWSSLLITCGSRDDRDYYRGEIGDPDSSWTQGKEFAWKELWYYHSAHLLYEFRKTQGCGSSGDVYLYGTYNYYIPIFDTIDTNSNNPEDIIDNGSIIF